VNPLSNHVLLAPMACYHDMIQKKTVNGDRSPPPPPFKRSPLLWGIERCSASRKLCPRFRSTRCKLQRGHPGWTRKDPWLGKRIMIQVRQLLSQGLIFNFRGVPYKYCTNAYVTSLLFGLPCWALTSGMRHFSLSYWGDSAFRIYPTASLKRKSKGPILTQCMESSSRVYFPGGRRALYCNENWCNFMLLITIYNYSLY